jgi:predicted MFS family arabinose efflux permease
MRFYSLTLLFAAFIGTAYGIGVYLFGTLVPEMRAELGLTPAMIGVITGGAQAGTIIASLLIGFVWGRIGARETVLAAQAIIAISMVLVGLSTSAWQVLALLAVLGAMGASTWIPMVPLVQTVIPENRQGVALGLISSGLAYGVFVVGLAAPPLIAAYSWRAVWFAAGILAFCLFLVGLVVLSGLPPVRHVRRKAMRGKPESRQVTSWPAILIVAVNLMAGIALSPFQNYLTLLFRDLHHWSMPAATALWSAIGLGGMAGGIVFGLLADRFGAKWSIVLVNLLMLASCLVTLLVPAEAPVYAALVVFGMAYNAIFGLFAAWISRRFAAAAAAQLMGFTMVSSGLGSMSGNYSAGLITGLAGGYILLYTLIAALTALLALMSLMLPDDRPGRRHGTPDPHKPPA